MKKIRCALYDRVSTDIQVRDGLSLDAQREALTSYAKAHGYEIVDYYSDEGLTARKKMQNRKELLRLLSDVRADKIDLILVTKLDRWFRNIKDYHNTQALLERHNCNWKTIFEEYDTSTANGRFAINIMLSVNENECDRDSDRIREVFAYKRRNGEILSGAHASFGYRAVEKKFVKDETARPIVEDFFEHYFIFYSKRKTVNYIMEKYGSLAPSESTLMYMFKNPVYYGCAYGTENFCEAYITREQFFRIKESGSIKVYSKSNEPYLFSGLIKCPLCGRNFSGFRHKTKKAGGKVYVSPAYHCKQKQRSGLLCAGGITVHESTVEKFMLGEIERRIGELTALQFSFRLKPRKENGKDPKTGRERLQAEQKRLNLLFQKGRITEAYYDSQYAVLAQKLDQAEKTPKEAPDLAPGGAFALRSGSFTGGFWEAYFLLDKEHKQAFWHDGIAAIRIDPDTHRLCGFDFQCGQVS